MQLTRVKVSQHRLDTWEWLTNMTRKSFTLQRVSKCHTELSHAEPLKKSVSSNLLPSSKTVLGQCTAARDHESDALKLLPDLLLPLRHCLEMSNHLLVNRWYRHEQGKVAAISVIKQDIPGSLVGVLRDQCALGTSPESSVDNVLDSMDVMKRQDVADMIILSPAPFTVHCGHLGLERAMGVDNALGATSGSRGEDNHRILTLRQWLALLLQQGLALETDISFCERIHRHSENLFEALSSRCKVTVTNYHISLTFFGIKLDFTLCTATVDRNADTIQVPGGELSHGVQDISVSQVQNLRLLHRPLFGLPELDGHLSC